ncbi:MAG TPA: serine/threonine-protein kinase [Thermoanaerobaculia bacterium]|nr:serine/threonine-protein kinase [Thermoanaerobaculia bacterium]
MGAVYLAERADATYEKKAAIKLLKRGMDTEELVRRFRSERRILARLEHTHIGRLLDGGSTPDGRPYLVMEYVEGRPIDAWCAERSLPIEDRLALFEKVCRAVHFAHRNLVVHRDLKPGNILVGADGEPRLLDFGIAKLLEGDPEPHATVMAFLPMTPEYASPEQIRGEPVTTATDVYSLGVLLYRLLAGRSPYRPAVEGRAALAEAVCSQVPQRPSTVVGARAKAEAETPERAEKDRHLAKRLRGDLDTIVQKALSKEPARRYESAEQLAADINRHLHGLPVLARTSGVGYRTKKFVGRHKIGVALAAAALIALVSTAAWALVQRSEALRERDRAEDEKEKAKWASDFMTGVFGASDPSESRGKEIKAIDLLDVGRRQLVASNDQPDQRAQQLTVLGRVYIQLGQYEVAKDLFKRSVSLLAQAKTVQGFQRAEAILGLAQAESNLGHDEQAEESLKSGLLLLERAPGGRESTDYVDALNDYGGFLSQKSDRYDDAEKQFRHALAIEQKPGRSRDRAVSVALAGLGQLERSRENYKKAEGFIRRSLELRRHAFGEPSIEVANAMNSLAVVLEELKNDRDAEDFYARSIAMRKTVLGSSHPKLATPLSNLADFYEQHGQRAKAEASYREAVAICDKSGNEDRNCGFIVFFLARLLANQKRCGEAETLGVKAISLLEAKSGDQETIAEAKGVVGGCRAERRDFAGAEPLLLGALAQLPPDSVVEKGLRERIVRLYEAMGKPDSAAKYRPTTAKPDA